MCVLSGPALGQVDSGFSGVATLTEDEDGLVTEAGSQYELPPDGSWHQASGETAEGECDVWGHGGGGAAFEFNFVETSEGDCFAYVILHNAEPADLPSLPQIGPMDLLPTAFDRMRSLAELPQLELAPARLGLTGLRSFFWLAETPPTVSATATVPGLAVTAEASPARYVWRFDDGAPMVTYQPGRAWTKTRPGNIAHMYETKGTYDISVEVIYAARWRVGGGPWQPLGYFSNTDTADYQVQELKGALSRGRH